VYKIFSVDDHIIEPADVWSSRVPTKYRELAPHVVEEDGREYWEYEGQRNMTMGLNAVAGMPRDQWGMEPARYSDMIPGCYNPAERAKDLLSQGVVASVNFPTLPRFGGMLFSHFDDKQLASICVEAYNDFIIDEWCPGGPEGMFVPMVICQAWEPELAAKEIERCADRGAKSLCFTENPVPDGLPTFHDVDHWAPIWRACEETDLAVSMHIGSSGSIPMIDPNAPFTGMIAAGEVSAMLSMLNMLVSPTLLRFPKLRLVYSEGGIGWVPAMLHRADRQLDRHSGWAGKVEMKPSELFRRNVWVCMVEEPMGLQIAYPRIGADKIVCELDYPHADSTFPHTQISFKEVFDGIPDDVVEQVSYRNAERLFNWTSVDESLLESPDVSTWRATLVDDPFAAMKRRHDVAGIEHVTTSAAVDDGSCHHMVTVGNMMVTCGKALVEGACPDGH
jgi:predicted TIM-barrel fold metal-dependent hydrolase